MTYSIENIGFVIHGGMLKKIPRMGEFGGGGGGWEDLSQRNCGNMLSPTV